MHPLVRLLILIAITQNALADWPQFRGERRDGIVADAPPLLLELPTEGLPEKWSYAVGAGFAGPVVIDGNTLIFHRLSNQATLDCLDSENGTQRWRYDYETSYRDDFGFDPGPRSPPTVSRDAVFVYGPEGVLSAVSLATGSRIWANDLSKSFHAPKGFFGRAGAPLAAAGNILMNAGGSSGNKSAGIIALDERNGDLVWGSTSHEASYSSPIITQLDGKTDTAIFLTRDGLLGISPSSGTPLFETPYRPSINASVNAASPVMCGPERVFISTCYGVGASLWEIAPNKEPRKIWMREGILDAHYATPVFLDGKLYGFHGRQESSTQLRCIDAASGEIHWSTDDLSCGQLIAVSNQLIALTEDGEVAMLDATPETYRLRWRTQACRRPTRAVPAFSDGFLYLRGPKRLVCLDLRNPDK